MHDLVIGLQRNVMHQKIKWFDLYWIEYILNPIGFETFKLLDILFNLELLKFVK